MEWFNCHPLKFHFLMSVTDKLFLFFFFSNTEGFEVNLALVRQAWTTPPDHDLFFFQLVQDTWPPSCSDCLSSLTEPSSSWALGNSAISPCGPGSCCSTSTLAEGIQEYKWSLAQNTGQGSASVLCCPLSFFSPVTISTFTQTRREIGTFTLVPSFPPWYL
jgi:hypothetical protein